MNEEYDRTDSKYIAYHYCSVESFFNIIQNKTLWLSDAEYMNDKKEIIWIDEVVKKAIIEIKEVPKYSDKILHFEQEYLNLKHKKNYILSFSKEKDLLSQWRGYGDDSAGVSIGFHFGLTTDIIGIPPRNLSVSKMPESEAESNVFKFGYQNIYYKSDRIKEEIIKAIDVDENYDMAALITKETALSLKHQSFKEEKEIRLIYTPENNFQMEQNSFLDKAVLNISSDLKHRVAGKQIIPYYEFDFNSSYNSLLIPEIMLGSKCQLKKDDLDVFLKSNGFDSTKILISESTYR